MSFSESIQICFTKYADFKGTASRSEFWWFSLFTVVAYELFRLFVPGLAFVLSLAVFLPSLAVSVRRNHDVGRSGWWILAPLYDIYLWCQPTKVGDNPYAAAGATTTVWGGTPQGEQFCVACGKLLQGGLNFCPACGTAVVKR